MARSKSRSRSRSKKPRAEKPTYPTAIGELLDGRFLVERYFNSELLPNYYLGTYHDSDRTRWIFIKMKHNQDSNDIDMIRWEYKIYKSLETSAGMLRVPRAYYNITMETASGPLHIGTHIRYMSINAHRGVEQSRRDDLESIGYLLAYLFRGELPWIELENNPNEEECHERIAVCKEKSLSTICQNMLPEFQQYLTDVRKLSFDEKPNYQNLGELFQNVQRFIGFESKLDLYDWNGFHQPKN
uniref:Tau-tubulin kinase homolog Asator-like n=1 Tax=Dermatophagoides pteronyssinus TaxID=6956 RepID=A0A6P6XXV8_DERPT|nr:tau-tubulin kinase homolog Asator-like [Dermatophagoides pteronyssinus]